MKKDQSPAQKDVVVHWNGACGIGEDLPGACGALLREIVDRVARHTGLLPDEVDAGYHGVDYALCQFISIFGRNALELPDKRERLFNDFGAAMLKHVQSMRPPEQKFDWARRRSTA